MTTHSKVMDIYSFIVITICSIIIGCVVLFLRKYFKLNIGSIIDVPNNPEITSVLINPAVDIPLGSYDLPDNNNTSFDQSDRLDEIYVDDCNEPKIVMY